MRHVLFAFGFLFLVSCTHGETVTITYNINGPGCKHFLVSRGTEPIKIYYEDDIFRNPVETDDALMILMRNELERTGSRNKAQAKTAIEAIDFTTSFLDSLGSFIRTRR